MSMEQRVLRLLAQSMAPMDPLRAASERELQQMLNMPASTSLLAPLLQQIVLLPDSNQHAQVTHLDPNLRLLAVLWLKQFLKQQWKQSNKQMSETERAQMKQVLLFAALHEPNATIALHLALILAQIARVEFPNQWTFDQLFTPILQALQSSVEHQQTAVQGQQGLLEQRSIDLTYRIVKELATRRLMVHRKQLAMLSVEILPLLQQHWNSTATRISEHLWAHCQLSPTTAPPAAALQTATDRLAQLLTLTKLLSTMFLNAFRDLVAIQNGELVRSALIQFYERLENLVRFRHSIIEAIGAGADSENSEMMAMIAIVDKCTHRIASVVVSIQKSYPIEFRDYLSPFLNLFWNVLGSLVPGNPLTAAADAPRRLQIEALQFFANVLSCRLYKTESLSSADGGGSSVVSKVITATGDVSLTDAMVLEALNAINGFFSSGGNGENRFEVLQQLTVMQYMRLTAKDLDEWQSDPEAFSALTESLTAQESVRACAENLFLTLLQNYPEQTIPGLTQMSAAASSSLADIVSGSSGPSEDDPRILDVDAVLLAIGLGCYDLHSVFEFEPWFTSNLAPILVSPAPSMGSIRGLPVLRYRIVWLVSCWLAQLSTTIRPVLYETLLNPAAFFHQHNADAALKLRVVQSLESMVNDWGFEVDAFAPFLPQALECLFTFFPQTEESESKMKILSCLEAIIQTCGVRAVVFSEQISAPLPAMWMSDSDASNLVRGKILQLLAKLVSCVKESQTLASTQREAGELQQANQGVQKLVEMCLQVVRFATDVSNPDEVFLMESGLELWSEALAVSTVYTEELHLLFGNLLHLMKRDYEHVKLALQILKQYVRLGQAQFWQAYHASVAELFFDVLGNVKADACVQLARTQELIVAMFPSEQVAVCAPVLTRMIEACMLFVRKDAAREPEMAIVGYLSVLARLLMRHFEFAIVNIFKNDQDVLGNVVIDLMLVKFFSVGSSSLNLVRRKVWAISLCSVLPILSDEHLEKSGQILELSAEVLDEEQEERTSEQQRVNGDAEEERDGAGAYRAYRTHRQTLRATSEEDKLVKSTDLKALACFKLSELAAKLGPIHFEQLLQTVDSSVLCKFQS